MVEHSTADREVPGSIPGGPLLFFFQNEEKDRNEERTKMNTVKMTEFERMYEEHEQGRKTAEAQCQQLDEQLELNEVALIEARQVAEDSNHKYEESVRKGQSS